MSLYTFMFIGTSPVGSIVAGAIAQRWGAPVATSVCATTEDLYLRQRQLPSPRLASLFIRL